MLPRSYLRTSRVVLAGINSRWLREDISDVYHKYKVSPVCGTLSIFSSVLFYSAIPNFVLYHLFLSCKDVKNKDVCKFWELNRRLLVWPFKQSDKMAPACIFHAIIASLNNEYTFSLIIIIHYFGLFALNFLRFNNSVQHLNVILSKSLCK